MRILELDKIQMNFTNFMDFETDYVGNEKACGLGRNSVTTNNSKSAHLKMAL
jgi:hypothetical protein